MIQEQWRRHRSAWQGRYVNNVNISLQLIAWFVFVIPRSNIRGSVRVLPILLSASQCLALVEIVERTRAVLGRPSPQRPAFDHMAIWLQKQLRGSHNKKNHFCRLIENAAMYAAYELCAQTSMRQMQRKSEHVSLKSSAG